MAMAFDVCVRGGGIVGRALALLLARERLRVGLVTRASGGAAPRDGADGASSDIRAYALNDTSRDLLLSLRAWPDARHATPVRAMHVHGDDGGRVAFSAASQGREALAWIVDVPALQSRLAEAVRFQPLVDEIDAAAPAPAAPLTVVCEGRASATRAEFGVEFHVTPYRQTAIAARLRCEKPHGGVARQWFAGGDVLAFLPLEGADGNLVAVVWSVQEERVGEALALDDAAFAERLAQASGGALGQLAQEGERAAWPLQLARAARWVGSMEGGMEGGMERGGRGWALAGDAAHNVHPLAGQGLNLGLADALELARVLQAREYWRGLGDVRLLRRYERARQADVLAMGAATDGLQQLFALEGGGWQSLRNWGMRGFERSGPLKAWVARQAMGLGR